MCPVYKLNKQGDNRQSFLTPFSILNQSVVPYRVLIVASWHAYRFLRRQVRWSGSPISLRVLHRGYGPYSIVNERESESEVTQSCRTLCDSIVCSLPGFFIHGIFPVRVPEWVAISYSRGSSQPRGWTRVSCIAGRCFTLWATREDPVEER